VRRSLALLAVWTAATAVGLAFAWKTHVGWVIWVFNQRHGVHQGDVVAFVVAYAWAAVASIAVIGATGPRRHQ
jgi:hypothetical protein